VYNTLEPEVIKPDNWLIKNHQYFTKIFTSNLNLVNENSNYYHIKNLNNSIDIVYDMLIDTVEYITGNIREHVFLDKNILLVEIQPFSNKYIFKGMGINNGDFICNFIYIPIAKKTWDKISTDDKNNIINIFNRIK
jgi:hypothetical protein